MNIGMLWFDNSKKPLTERIQKAADYYARKYGQTPNKAVVPPGELSGAGETVEIAGVKVATNAVILPNHIWIGHEEQARLS